jgi:hypothetical protein
MVDKPEEKLNRRFTTFQRIILIWMVLLTAVVAFIAVSLLRARASVQSALTQAANDGTDLADDHLTYTVNVRQTIPISTSIAIDEEIPVPVSLEVNHTITVDN